MRQLALAALLVLMSPAAATEAQAPLPAGLVLDLTLRDGRPMIAARVGDRGGVVMFDTGTPYPLMLNRDALDLPEAPVVARGHAASGQEIVVQAHPAPEVSLGGGPLVLPDTLPSGNFGFTRDGLGADFLGFLGLPAVAGVPFELDIAGGRLVIGPAPPGPGATLSRIEVALPPDGLPEWQGRVGALPFRFDIDTGDGGTLYATPATRAALEADGRLSETPDGHRVSGLAFGGGSFDRVPVRVVAAGGTDDHRNPPRGDLLRLGAGFLAQHRSYWDLPGRNIGFFAPDARPAPEHP